jgi:hypothetical protein
MGVGLVGRAGVEEAAALRVPALRTLARRLGRAQAHGAPRAGASRSSRLRGGPTRAPVATPSFRAAEAVLRAA